MSLCGELVLVNNAANSVTPANAVLVVAPRRRKELEERRALLEGAVRPMPVVVRHVLAQHPVGCTKSISRCHFVLVEESAE